LNDFGTFGITIAPAVTQKCLELLSKYKITSETLVDSWVAFSTTKYGGDGPDLDTLRVFDKDVLSKENFCAKTAHDESLDDSLVIHNITTINQIAEDDDLLGSYGTPVRKSTATKRSTTEGTPQNKRLAGLGQSYPTHSPTLFSPSTPGSQTNKFSTRTNAGEVVAKFPNKESNGIEWTGSLPWQPSVQSFCPQSSLNGEYKYMFSRLRDKHELLNEHIHQLGDIMADTLKIEEWNPNNELQSDKFQTVGRICCDGSSGSRLNASSILLEGTKDISSGQSVPLDVSHVKEYSFFPGQIVAVNGSNPTGKKIVVNAVTTPSVNPTPKTEISFSGPLNIMVACGPFTLCDDLDFAPMQELIDRINSSHPHLVILLGPFLDARNKKIESADLERTYQEEFDLFMDKLQASILNTVQVVMIPSWRDIHHHTVYPTAPLQPKKAQPNLHFYSDPCVLNVSGVFIALTSTDILFHLSKEEIAVTPQGSDRLGRLVTHLFSQQSFYPLHPAAEEMSIDLEHCDKHCRLPFPPHLLIVPSDLRHFIKNVEGCVVVNTERLVKGPSGGTYARLQVTSDESSVQIKGEIVRI